MTFTNSLIRLSGLLSLAASAQAAAYAVQDTFDQTNFFEGFDFFSGQDPTNGFVKYSSAIHANNASLAGYANNGIYLGVDYESVNPAGGRASVRVNSKASYTKGLFIADIAHQPAPACGQWPAFWTFGPNWPSSGEIDIIEGVNMDTNTTITLHTSKGCSFSKDSFSSGDCNAPGSGTTGCGAPTGNLQTFGTGFNEIGGGIYALEWTSQAIKIFFFPRTGPIPTDIASDTPDPTTWGAPAAQFSGSGCNIDEHFMNHQIVFDTTFCGDWAGKVFNDDPVCKAKANTKSTGMAACQAYVANNPADFKDSYWLINSVKVYSEGGALNKTTPKRFTS
ncbi:Uu.00g045220.m01.CDS01 [Anthostomella pinea]|uniref:endo-1,3(4)-beta-glucanase n=1 Tax=Anthostomella pinea TaxID=933095 RepID=A0AAI8VB07_9PEZI|nr:Uu.00g045220.m01.CDS01 [Anthostomella pinea]